MYVDVIIHISEYLTNQEKIRLSLTCHKIDKLKNKFTYYDKVDARGVQHLSYDFRYVFLDKATIADVFHFPKVTHIRFCYSFNEAVKISEGVKQVMFGTNYNQSIRECLPSSITHLLFRSHFNKSIEGCLPVSITHLSIRGYFNQPIKNCIPFGVTHLRFGVLFNQPIEESVPSSVTHLIFGNDFNQTIKNNIPSSVTHLVFHIGFNKPVIDIIPSSVTHLVLYKCYPHDIPTNIHVKLVDYPHLELYWDDDDNV
jgi:hypothetical protein